MHYLDYNEQIRHQTGDLPMAYYHVDERHPRYYMRMHWHRETELIHVRSGLLHLYVGDGEVDARAGDLVLLGEGVLHGGDPEDCVYECVVFDPYALLMHTEACRRVFKGQIGRTIRLENRQIVSESELFGAAERLFAWAQLDAPSAAPKAVGALYELFGALADCPEPSLLTEWSASNGAKAEQLKPALEYIENHYAETVTLEKLARLAGFSPKYFCRCFRAILHRSPIDYLNHYRIECASHFLTASDMTVAEIAQRCGYNDSSFFIKQFRKYKNTTPKQYRTAEQNKEESA